MNESLMGAITFLLGVILAILAVSANWLLVWLFWIAVAILIIYGLYMWLIRK